MTKKFKYKGKKRGKTIKGVIDAEGLVNARSKLRAEGIRGSKITEIKAKSKSSLDIQLTWGPFGAIPTKEIMVFTKKLATMIRSGLPIVDAMVLVGEQTRNKNLKRVAERITARLNGGMGLAQAFREHPRHFDTIYLNILEAGEISGKLDSFLDRLVSMLEKQHKIRQGIKSALFYPITLVVITLLITYGMLTRVVPVFQDMYEGLGAELPTPTQKIVDASNWIQNGENLLMIFLWVGGIWLGDKMLSKYIRVYKKTKGRIFLKIPLFGDIIMKSTVARMSLLMANLLAAGVSVIDTLEVARTVSKNLVFVDAVGRIKARITTGLELSVLFRQENVFPIALAQLMAVGERTGNMDEMLAAIARYYEEEFDAVVAGLSAIIEPLMIVFVGALIGVMVVALYLPIFSAGDAFSGG